MENEYLAVSWLGAVTNAIEKVSTGRAMPLSCLASGRTCNKSEQLQRLVTFLGVYWVVLLVASQSYDVITKKWKKRWAKPLNRDHNGKDLHEKSPDWQFTGTIKLLMGKTNNAQDVCSDLRN